MDIKKLLDEKIKQSIQNEIESCDKMIEEMYGNLPVKLTDMIFSGTVTFNVSELRVSRNGSIDKCTVEAILPDYMSRPIAQATVASKPEDNDIMFDAVISHFAVLGFTHQLRKWLKEGRFDKLIDLTRVKIGI